MITPDSPLWTEEHQQASEPDFYGKWISVKSELPTDKRVMAYTPNTDKSMEYRFIPAGMFKQVASDATHWMSLPNPPELLEK